MFGNLYTIDHNHDFYYKAPLDNWMACEYDYFGPFYDTESRDKYKITAHFEDFENKYLTFVRNKTVLVNKWTKETWRLNLPNKTKKDEVNKYWYPIFGFWNSYVRITVQFEE